MIGRFLCWIGAHRWTHAGGEHAGGLHQYHCERCPRIEWRSW